MPHGSQGNPSNHRNVLHCDDNHIRYIAHDCGSSWFEHARRERICVCHCRSIARSIPFSLDFRSSRINRKPPDCQEGADFGLPDEFFFVWISFPPLNISFRQDKI